MLHFPLPPSRLQRPGAAPLRGAAARCPAPGSSARPRAAAPAPNSAKQHQIQSDFMVISASAGHSAQQQQTAELKQNIY